mmetsp:Transcript_3300/g.10131  ORF Transcript_3300/g.10131 Transcript_3300/m.10131 type:complete len:105 (+) Transcript_3300:113-427(+)
MGPAHRRHSHRSSAKASGYLPWYCLSPEDRAAKAGKQNRTPPAKKKRRRSAESPSPPVSSPVSPARRRRRALLDTVAPTALVVAVLFLAYFQWRAWLLPVRRRA